MILVDNSKYLFSQIDKNKKDEIRRLRAEYEAEAKEAQAKARKSYNKQLELLKDEQEAWLDLVEKQCESKFQLEEKRKLMNAENELIDKVLNSIKKKVMAKKTTSKKILEEMYKKITRGMDSRVKKVHTYKGIPVKRRNKCLETKDFLLKLELEDGSYLEMTLDQFLLDNITLIKEHIQKL